MKGWIYESFKESLLDKTFSFDEGIHVALMDEGFVPSHHKSSWEDIRHHEVHGQGYISGGKRIDNVSIRRAGKTITIDGDDVIWPEVKFGMLNAPTAFVLYSSVTHRLIIGWELDFVGLCDRRFAIKWHANGIISELNPAEPPQYLTSYLRRGIGS